MWKKMMTMTCEERRLYNRLAQEKWREAHYDLHLMRCKKYNTMSQRWRTIRMNFLKHFDPSLFY